MQWFSTICNLMSILDCHQISEDHLLKEVTKNQATQNSSQKFTMAATNVEITLNGNLVICLKVSSVQWVLF